MKTMAAAVSTTPFKLPPPTPGALVIDEAGGSVGLGAGVV
jgi:hypothetical protein